MKIETLQELDTHLSVLNWSRAHLCRVLGLHRNTPSKWPPIPGYVVAYVDLALSVQEAIARISNKLDKLNERNGERAEG